MKKLVLLALLCISVTACRSYPLTETADIKPDLKPLHGPSMGTPEYLMDTPRPLDKSAQYYLKKSAAKAEISNCHTQVIEDDFGKPTVACVDQTGTAIFLQ